MRKFLSLILAIAMLATLMPTFAFATEGETEAAGYTIKYDIGGFMAANNYNWNTNGTWLTDMTFESTNGFFDFHSSSIGNAETVDSKLRCNGNNQLQIGSGTVVHFEIYVPVSGTYTIYINHKKASNGATASIYMKQGGEPSNAWNYQIGYLNSKSDTEELNARSVVTSDDEFTTPAQIELSAGYHYLTFKCPSYSWIGTIELVSGDGNGVVLTSMKTSVSRNILTVGGEPAKISVDELYLSDTTVASADNYSVSYRSSDENVATVSETGVITPVSEGDTTITVVAINEAGVEITSSEKIVVTDGATIKYDIVKHIKALGYKEIADVIYPLEGFTEAVTDGFYSFFPGSGSNVSNSPDHSKVKYYENIQLMTVGTKIAFKINVPVAGYYDIVHDIINATSTDRYAARKNTDVGVYISKNAIDTTLNAYVGSFNIYSDDYAQGVLRQATSGLVKFDEPGSYIITFKVDKSLTGQKDPFSAVYSFYLVGGDKSALMNGKITSTAASVNKDEGETATVSATGFNSETTAAEAFTYSSSDTAIAEVDAETGVVTPKKAGKVTITATAKGADIANTLTTEIEVTENKPGEEVAEKVSIYITKTEGGNVSADKVAVNEVTTANTGETITAEAEANDGYKFAYWKDSAGNVVSEDVKYTFNAFTNTSIIAVFDNVSGDAKKYGVEFFDGNRDFLGFVETEEGATFGSIENLPEHGLTGYAPKGWSIAENAIINGILRAVALYEEEGKEVSGITFNNGTVENTKYDEPVSNTVEGAKTWYRDEKLVGYGDSYTYYVWGDTDITSSTEDVEEKLPIAVLDKNGDSYMLEYDNAGYTIVDAGILFGDDTHNTVNACYYKAKVKNIKAHGQFTAKKSSNTKYPQTKVRGYVMFSDGDDIRVIYAD